MNDPTREAGDDSPVWLLAKFSIGSRVYYRKVTQQECITVQKTMYEETGEKLTPEEAMVEMYTYAMTSEDSTMLSRLGSAESLEVVWLNLKRVDHFVLMRQNNAPRTPYSP